MKKCGAHRLDQKRITNMQKDGLSAEKISDVLEIEIEYVIKFMVVKELPEPVFDDVDNEDGEDEDTKNDPDFN